MPAKRPATAASLDKARRREARFRRRSQGKKRARAGCLRRLKTGDDKTSEPDAAVVVVVVVVDAVRVPPVPAAAAEARVCVKRRAESRTYPRDET